MERIQFDKSKAKDSFRQHHMQFDLTTPDPNSKRVKGYIIVWDVLSSDRGGYFAVFPKDSMVLPPYPVALMYNHNDDYFLADETDGSFRYGTDDYGVWVEAELDDTFIDQFIYSKVLARKIRGMSVGMYALDFHREKYIVTEADAVGNSELAALIGQEVPIEIYDKWLIDECTFTGRPAFPQTTLENYHKDKGERGSSIEMNDTYIYQAKLIGLEITDDVDEGRVSESMAGNK